MTIRQLHYFVAVVETRSFTQAARRSGVAQTAVSQQIAALEKEMGLLLFHRNRRHVEPTEAGMAFYYEIRPLVVQLEGAIRSATAAGQRMQTQFRLGLAPEFPAGRLPQIFRKLAEAYPELNINVQCEQLSALSGPLKNGGLDAVLALGEELLDPRLIVSVPLEADPEPPFMLAFPADHPSASAPAVSWDSLEGECVIISRQVTEAPGFPEVEPYVSRLAAACPNTHSADSVDGVLPLVAAGLGVALIHAADYGRIPGTFRLVPVEPCPPSRSLALYYHRNNSRPELEYFSSLCQEILPDSN